MCPYKHNVLGSSFKGSTNIVIVRERIIGFLSIIDHYNIYSPSIYLLLMTQPDILSVRHYINISYFCHFDPDILLLNDWCCVWILKCIPISSAPHCVTDTLKDFHYLTELCAFIRESGYSYLSLTTACPKYRVGLVSLDILIPMFHSIICFFAKPAPSYSSEPIAPPYLPTHALTTSQTNPMQQLRRVPG